MLKKLHIENFVTIEDVTIDFYDGLSIITGETGAGKSLMIDSLSLLLGERASLDMIRNGKEKALIEGEFEENNPYLQAYLKKLGIFNLEKIIIKRTISETKSTAKINDVNVSISELKTVGSFLADIHQQFEVVKIFDSDNYLSILDGFKQDLIDEYLAKYNRLKEQLILDKKEYEQLLAKKQEVENNREELLNELHELEAFPLEEQYENDLENRISLLLNYDKIYSLVEETKQLFDSSSLDDIYRIKDNLKELSQYQSEYTSQSERLEEIYYEIEDMYRDIRHKFGDIEYNPNELEELQNNLSDFRQLKKKYKMDVDGLRNRRDQLKAILVDKEDFEVLIEDSKKKYDESFAKTLEVAKDISKIRSELANNVKNEVEAHLKDLGLDSKFNIEVTQNSGEDISIFKDKGIDDVNFFIETNVGEGLKPLAKVLSGGEASRLILAIKIIYLKSKKIKTVIFDEVDTGISGKTANLVAKKLYELAIDNQVIAISHLPQVARIAKTHYKISKSTIDGRTKTKIKQLSFDERVQEIAELISDGKVTQKQLEYAKELLNNRSF